MARGGIIGKMSTAGLALALFAFTFKALLPPGFMLDASDGRLAITLCNGVDAVFDPLTGRISHDDQTPSSETSQHCPFALAGVPTLTTPVLVVDAPAPRASVPSAAPARQAIGQHQTTGPPLPARGPPIHA